MTVTRIPPPVPACIEGVGGQKRHAAVVDRSTGAISATKCNYAVFNNSGARRTLYASGGSVNCKRCLAAIRRDQRETGAVNLKCF